MLFGVTTVGDVHHPLRPCFQGSLGRGQFFSVARVVQHFGLLQQRGAGQVNLQLQLRSRLKNSVVIMASDETSDNPVIVKKMKDTNACMPNDMGRGSQSQNAVIQPLLTGTSFLY